MTKFMMGHFLSVTMTVHMEYLTVDIRGEKHIKVLLGKTNVSSNEAKVYFRLSVVYRQPFSQ